MIECKYIIYQKINFILLQIKKPMVKNNFYIKVQSNNHKQLVVNAKHNLN